MELTVYGNTGKTAGKRNCSCKESGYNMMPELTNGISAYSMIPPDVTINFEKKKEVIQTSEKSTGKRIESATEADRCMIPN